MSEKRVDPEDGKAYTFDELKAFYAGKYKKKEIEAYWESTCTKAKAKAKAKAKVKAAEKESKPKAEAKAKAKADAKKTFKVKRKWDQVKTGDDFPDITFDLNFPPEKIEMGERCKGKKVIVIGIPGAFTPTWQLKHIPSFIEAEADLKKKGISEVFIMAAQDSAVMQGFGKTYGLKEDSIIKFVGDPSLNATKRLGVVLDIPKIRDLFGAPRCQRFALLVDGGKVKHAAVAGAVVNGEEVTNEDTFADKVMAHA